MRTLSRPALARRGGVRDHAACAGRPEVGGLLGGGVTTDHPRADFLEEMLSE